MRMSTSSLEPTICVRGAMGPPTVFRELNKIE